MWEQQSGTTASNIPAKGRIENIWGYGTYIVLFASTKFCHCGLEAATDKKQKEQPAPQESSFAKTGRGQAGRIYSLCSRTLLFRSSKVTWTSSFSNSWELGRSKGASRSLNQHLCLNKLFVWSLRTGTLEKHIFRECSFGVYTSWAPFYGRVFSPSS